MKFHLFKFTCKKCGAIYKAPEVCASAYGEFLMRSPAGEVVYLNAVSDPVYSQVFEFLKHLPGLKGLSQVELASIQRKVFGVACDKDREGNKYSIENKPVCDSCGSQEPNYWEATEPPEFVNLDIPAVTHNDWLKLDKTEMLDVLERAV